MQPQNNNMATLAIQAELLNIYKDWYTEATRERERLRTQRRLNARRSIELRREQTQLEQLLKDPWQEG